MQRIYYSSRARVINSSWFSCFFVGFFFRPDYQSPTRSAVAVGEIILLLLKISVGWELVVYPSNTHVLTGCRFSLPHRKYVVCRLPVVVRKKVTALLITKQTLTG